MNIDLGEAIDSKLDRSKWENWKFSDLVDNIVEKVKPQESGLEHYIGLEHLDSGSLHIKRFGESKTLIGDKLKIYKDDIIFAKRNAYLKRVSIAPFDAVASAHSLVLRPKKENVLPEFLPFFLLSEKFWERAIEISVGSLSPTINWKSLAKQEFLLPPKDQQAKLAELLWAMDEVVERENDLLGKLLITNETQCKSSVDFGYNSNKLKLPDGWRMMKIKDFSTVQAGSTPLRSNTEFFNKGIHPWVKTLDLNNDSILSTEEKITDLALEKTSCKLREIGTILVAMYGGFNQIGRTGLLKIEAATNQAISAVMMDQNIVLPEYLLLVLNTKINYWKKVAISSRKDPNITKVDVENFPVPVPSLAIQESILLNTNSILRSIESSKSKISSSKALQKSLINQVF